MSLYQSGWCAITEWQVRSEEHTSELQSQSNLVCRLLLEKKKNKGLSISTIHRDTVPDIEMVDCCDLELIHAGHALPAGVYSHTALLTASPDLEHNGARRS